MGLEVNVWTVNAPHDLRAMVEAGVDTVITDRLGDALAAAGAGRWAEPTGDPAGAGEPQAGPPRNGACHRAEWRGTAPVHKDGRP